MCFLANCGFIARRSGRRRSRGKHQPARRQRHGRRLQIDTLRAGTESEIDAAFAGLPAGSDRVLLSSPEPFLYSRRAQIIALAARYNVPAAFDTRDYVDDGGLLSYGADFLDVLRRAGVYVGRILKGEKPATLPVEQSDKFELAINLRTAKSLGLTVPPTLLARADEVVE